MQFRFIYQLSFIFIDPDVILTAGSNEKQVIPPSTRSFAEVFTKLQLSKLGIQDWSFSDLTVGLYLIYLSQASAGKVEEVKGVQVTSDVAVISWTFAVINFLNCTSRIFCYV